MQNEHLIRMIEQAEIFSSAFVLLLVFYEPGIRVRLDLCPQLKHNLMEVQQRCVQEAYTFRFQMQRVRMSYNCQ